MGAVGLGEMNASSGVPYLLERVGFSKPLSWYCYVYVNVKNIEDYCMCMMLIHLTVALNIIFM